MTYTADRLWKEVVYVAYYLHWPSAEILDLEHHVRTKVIGEIGGIHTELGP
ncbi:DUF6760 family protein [Amycolatopsis sp. BJA-103]|uniref:DUF6760 family protein n=1 Tax=unclassified Amycolatopsis TaxID=2618356 RepID=UPI00143D0556|nr:DUF6760 family protein [Amycolatopsis sp. BJA-103]